MKYLRAGVRASVAIALLPVLGVLALAQGLVIGPLTGNYSRLPTFAYKKMRPFFGYRIEFNAASAPIPKDKAVWFVANHQSNSDFVVLGSALDGTFAGKGDILKWPFVAQMARAIRYIGLRRTKEFNGQSRAKIIQNFNRGYNTIMFPEGTTEAEAPEVNMFHAGLFTLLYGEKGTDKKGRTIALEKDVVVQPVAIRVREIHGQGPARAEDVQKLYAMYHENNMLTRIWKKMLVRGMTIEVTLLPPLNPREFADERDLINTAAEQVAKVVNPGQTVFEKAHIPVMPSKKAAA